MSSEIELKLRLDAKSAYKLARKHATLNADDRHRMRITLKKLRYASEFFAPLLPAKRLATLDRLQEELGRINNHVTAETLIKELLPHRPCGPLHGWMSGRHALPVEQLPTTLDDWPARQA